VTGFGGEVAGEVVLGRHRARTPDGLHIRYVDTGPTTPRAVALLHSLGTDHHIWLPQVTVLGRRHRVLAPDTRGHGSSDRGGRVSVEDWVADLDSVLDAAGVEEAALVGVSQGGIQAVAYAAAHPERVAAMVVADSFVELEPAVASRKVEQLSEQANQQGMVAVAESYVHDTFDPAAIPSGAEQVREAIASMAAEDYVAAVSTCFRVNISDRLASVRVPTLVLWGAHDHKTPRVLSEQIAAGIAGAELKEVPNAGHLSNVDNPEGFTDLVERFLFHHVATGRPDEPTRH